VVFGKRYRGDTRRAGHRSITKHNDLAGIRRVPGPGLAEVATGRHRWVCGEGGPEGWRVPCEQSLLKAEHGTEVALLTFHRKARLPLQLGRIPAELIVRAKDQGDIGCLGLANWARTRSSKNEYAQLCMPPSQYRGVMLEKLPE